MPFEQSITRNNPSCMVFVVDQSTSTSDLVKVEGPLHRYENPVVVDGRTYTTWAEGRSLAHDVADAVNRLLTNLVIKCTKDTGVRRYFEIGLIVYGEEVRSGFGGVLAGRDLVPIDELADNPLRIEQRGEIQLCVWLAPSWGGGTPMCQALALTQSWVADFALRNPHAFPPVVFHITDGMSTDGDPSMAMEGVKGVSTSDGNTLLFNLHLTSGKLATAAFCDRLSIADANAATLFNGASVLIPNMVQEARASGFTVSDRSRGFVYNGDIATLIHGLLIGSVPANRLR